jgi:hypothetical protein
MIIFHAAATGLRPVVPGPPDVRSETAHSVIADSNVVYSCFSGKSVHVPGVEAVVSSLIREAEMSEDINVGIAGRVTSPSLVVYHLPFHEQDLCQTT